MTDAPEILRLSPLQVGLVAWHDIFGGEEGYTVAAAMDVAGPLDRGALKEACATVVGRHPQLCARFRRPEGAGAVMAVPPKPTLMWAEREATPEDLAAVTDECCRGDWDLAGGRTHRFALITVGPDRHRLVLGFHHAVIDAWSLGIVAEEIATAYGFGAPALPPAPALRDYAAWLATQSGEEDAAWWRDYLAGLPGPTAVARGSAEVVAETDADAADAASPAPRTTVRDLTDAEGSDLEAAARRLGITPAALAITAWGLVVSRMIGESDFVLGVSIAGRPASVAGIDRLVGALTTTVPLRIRLIPGEAIGDACRRVHADLAAVAEHGALPPHLIEEAAGIADLFDVAVIMHNVPRLDGQAVELPDGTSWSAVDRDTYSHYPLVCAPGSVGGRWYVALDDDRGRLPGAFDPDDVIEQVREAIASICADPAGDYRGRGAVREVVVAGGAQDAHDAGDPEPGRAGGIDAAVWARAAETPDALALWADGRWWTYSELVRWAQGMATLLREKGIGPGDRVAIRLPRRAEYIGSLLAVLRAGAVAVPVDPAAPSERSRLILQRGGVRAVIGDGAEGRDDGARDGAEAGVRRIVPVAVSDVEPDETVGEPRNRAAHDDPAYVVFTSGSTGVPKGVVATHGGILALHRNHALRIYGSVEPRHGRLRVAHVWSFAFDAAWQPQLALLSGHELVLLDEETRRDPDRVVSILRDLEVDMIDTSPSMLKPLRRAGLLERGGLQILALGSEDISPDVWDDLAACESVAVHNFYGPTETTVEVTSARVTPGSRPMIGEPAIGTRAYVLGADFSSVPAGWPGELYVGGPQVAHGYMGDAPLTAAHFVAEPGHPGRRMYRTGDIVRLTDGEGGLTYLGRADRQVKVRGHRIELGEIEAGLRRCGGVEDAAVTTVDDALGTRVVAVVVGDAEPGEIRDRARKILPRYLVPDRILVVDAIPLDANGKTRIRELAAEPGDDDPGRREPVTVAQRIVADAIRSLCGIESVGLDDELRAMGIDSISVASLIAELRRRGAAITIREAWEASTVEDLARRLSGRFTSENGDRGEPGDVSTAVAGPLPATAVDGPMLRWIRRRGEWKSYALLLPLRITDSVTPERVRGALVAVARAHPALASRWIPRDDGTWEVIPCSPRVAVSVHPELAGENIGDAARKALADLDPGEGVLLSAAVPAEPDAATVVVCIHHLACDSFSLRVILEDLRTVWDQPGETPPEEPATPFEWEEWRRFPVPGADEYWESVLGRLTTLPRDAAPATYGETRTKGTIVPITADQARVCGENVVLAAYACAWAETMGDAEPAPVSVILEEHGRRATRSPIDERPPVDERPPMDGRSSPGPRSRGQVPDVGRTVGWLSTLFPHVIGGQEPPTPAELQSPGTVANWLGAVARARDAVGDYGPAAWTKGALADDGGWAPADSLVVFLGHTSSALGGGGTVSASTAPATAAALPTETAPGMVCPHAVELSVGVDVRADGAALSTVWRWQPTIADDVAEELRNAFHRAVALLSGDSGGGA